MRADFGSWLISAWISVGIWGILSNRLIRPLWQEDVYKRQASDPTDAPVIIPTPIEVPEEVVDENVEFVVVEEMPVFRPLISSLC